jgi:hypothetical protein
MEKLKTKIRWTASYIQRIFAELIADLWDGNRTSNIVAACEITIAARGMLGDYGNGADLGR